MKNLIHGLSREEMARLCAELGQAPYRAGQVWRWLYHHYAENFNAMKNIPEKLRADLNKRFSLEPFSVIRREDESGVGSTAKVLLRLADGECIELVFIPAKGRTTLCVSSQVGCKYKCAFCASGQSGFRRNLECGEIVGEVVYAARQLGNAPSHVVFMGIGEPFDNYDNVLAAVRIINDSNGLSVGARKITISTCGIIPGIERLAQEGLQVELSVSLHAPDDALRSKLIPANKIYPLADLLAACRQYAEKTGRIVTFEYTLIKDVNDSKEQARQLARLIKPLHCRVNLIMLSTVTEFAGRAPSAEAAKMFVDILERAKINATVRASKGGHINAACGQLRYSSTLH
ncbi:MAG: 23S rRNA (adenine(2503)-C(2))-methyltransferase RlmN [Kiritimatiellia bacterium]|nr:23S rRNA (adenine(2503)-C(2))-methyltransferase RlmN [Kiritimatiellia bacterium]